MTDTDDQRAGGPGTSSSGLYFSMTFSLQTLRLPAVVSVREEEPDPNRSPEIDRDYEEIEWDLAITNQRNAELRQRNSVKEFFAKVKNIKSVWDEDTREWLTMLPHTMHGEAIPLFESNIDGV